MISTSIINTNHINRTQSDIPNNEHTACEPSTLNDIRHYKHCNIACKPAHWLIFQTRTHCMQTQYTDWNTFKPTDIGMETLIRLSPVILTQHTIMLKILSGRWQWRTQNRLWCWRGRSSSRVWHTQIPTRPVTNTTWMILIFLAPQKPWGSTINAQALEQPTTQSSKSYFWALYCVLCCQVWIVCIVTKERTWDWIT